jgi:hypothetical protein
MSMRHPVPKILTGGCQCGSVRYEIAAEPVTCYVCHCTECQHQSASAFGISLSVPRAALRFVKGRPKEWRRVSESGREIMCLFCGHCGTRLAHNPARDAAISNLKAGTLDDTAWLRPVAHLWTRSKQPWVQIPAGMPIYETQPEDYAIFATAWKKLIGAAG